MSKFIWFMVIFLSVIGFVGCGDTVGCFLDDNQLVCGEDTLDFDDLRGEDGQTGPVGPQGEPGESIVGPEGPSGPQGEPGDSGLIVGIIDPCGDDPDNPDEVLYILFDGRYSAWYKNVGLVVLEDGTYRTTDKQKCEFEISENGTVFEEL